MIDKNYFVNLFSEMIEVNAVNPSGDGPGEALRASMLKNEVLKWGDSLKFEEYTADSNGIKRPNLLFLLDVKKESTIWFVAHIDTVGEGDTSLWKYPPFKGTVEGDRIYGRGTCDDGQGVISSLVTLKYFLENKDEAKSNVGVMLVSDEEAGSKYGIDYVLNNRTFSKNDIFVVPDSGTPNGDTIEVSEKGKVWMKVTVIGKQCHASTPDAGKNAHRYARELDSRMDKTLHSIFNERDDRFGVPRCTIEPTRVDTGTTSINIVPGKESFYYDIRIIPRYTPDDFVREIEKIRKNFSKEFGVEVVVEILRTAKAIGNSPEGVSLVNKFSESIKKVRNVTAKATGIGGGTCAVFFRKRGHDAIVWGSFEETEHMPNEYAKISSVFADADVFIDFIKSS